MPKVPLATATSGAPTPCKTGDVLRLSVAPADAGVEMRYIVFRGVGMPYGDRKAPLNRAATDAGLRVERAKTDKEFADRTGGAESVDSALRKERDRADVRFTAARQREDEGGSGRAADEVVAERSREDAAVARDRESADAALAGERVRRQLALAGLLASERDETDARLLAERRGSDETLANRDEFLAILSHDMRSLLGNIALNVSVLEREPHDPVLTTRGAESIKRSTAQLTRLVADLLDVATFDAGKFVLFRGRHDAGSIVREAAEGFELTAAGKGLSLFVDVPNEELIADCDPDRIAQVLGNLLGNAAKFTRAGGEIRVGVAPRGADVRFFVTDTGEGIPPEKLETIFERYSQIGRADRRGLGLGLYISRLIVEAHGGRLWAESAPGRGSTFSFTVPIGTGSLA